jgi:glycosyltransferase involved in cell wall biosynthesis
MIGGAEIQIRTVGERLAGLGHEVWVASRHRFEHPQIGSLTTARLWRGLRALRPDLVVATVAMRTSIKAAVLCRLLGLGFIYRLATTEESRYRIGSIAGGGPLSRLAMYVMLRYLTTRIWCQHEVQMRNFERRGLGKRAFVAVNLVPDRRRPAAGGVRDTVLWIGRYHANKQPRRFVDLADRLSRRQCLMICPGIPDDFRAEAETRPNLRVVDYLPPEELTPHYARSRVLVSTSDVEGSPHTFIEAACQGTPVFATALDPGGFFERYGYGRVIADPERLAREIDRLFEDDGRFAELSANARRYFEEVHDLERHFGHLQRSLGL